MSRLVEKIGEDRYRFNADYKRIWQKLMEYEDAEEKGLIVRPECHCKDCIYWADRCAGCTDRVKLCVLGGYMVGENGYCVYAEKKL